MTSRWSAPEGFSVRNLLIGFAAVSILIRLVALDARVAHWDEARIAFWILQYQASGEWSYFPVHHGPFLFHVNRMLFSVLGPTDATMRLPTAVVGGVLPLAALLFRDYLDDLEVLSMGALLGLNPILLYYSRFMRNDLLVAAFALAGLGFGLRAATTGRRRYLIGLGAFLGLAFTTKENALLYVLAWVGAGTIVVVWHQYLVADPPSGKLNSRLAKVSFAIREALRTVAGQATGFAERLSSRATDLALTAVVFSLVVFVFYLPRGPDTPGLTAIVRNPANLPAALEAGLLEPPRSALGFWLFGSAQGDYSYAVFFGLLIGLLLVGATATIVLATIGARRSPARPLVVFAVVWALLSIVGYPAASDLMTGWIALHVVVPLTIPGAVGLAAGIRETPSLAPWLPSRRALLSLFGAYLLLVGGLTSFVAPGSTYNPLGQPSQMDGAAADSIEAMERYVGTGNPDVTYVGSYWEDWIHRLPFIWYLERAEADRTVVDSAADLDRQTPIVIAHANRSSATGKRFPDYRCTAHERVPWEGGDPDGLPGSVLICVREDS